MFGLVDLRYPFKPSVFHIGVYKVLIKPIKVLQSLLCFNLLYKFGSWFSFLRLFFIFIPFDGRQVLHFFWVFHFKRLGIGSKLLELFLIFEKGWSLFVQAAAHINLFNFCFSIFAIFRLFWVVRLRKVLTDSYSWRSCRPSEPHL